MKHLYRLGHEGQVAKSVYPLGHELVGMQLLRQWPWPGQPVLGRHRGHAAAAARKWHRPRRDPRGLSGIRGSALSPSHFSPLCSLLYPRSVAARVFLYQ